MLLTRVAAQEIQLWIALLLLLIVVNVIIIYYRLQTLFFKYVGLLYTFPKQVILGFKQKLFY